MSVCSNTNQQYLASRSTVRRLCKAKIANTTQNTCSQSIRLLQLVAIW